MMKIMEKMKEILRKCQECQAEVLAMGSEYSFDIYVSRQKYGNSVHTKIFRDIEIGKEWCFYDWRSEEENNSVAEEMEEYIKNLKK